MPEKETLELNYDEDSIVRLQKEIDFIGDKNAKLIGKFLLEEFKSDETLKADYGTKKEILSKYSTLLKKRLKRVLKGKITQIA